MKTNLEKSENQAVCNETWALSFEQTSLQVKLDSEICLFLHFPEMFVFLLNKCKLLNIYYLYHPVSIFHIIYECLPVRGGIFTHWGNGAGDLLSYRTFLRPILSWFIFHQSSRRSSLGICRHPSFILKPPILNLAYTFVDYNPQWMHEMLFSY